VTQNVFSGVAGVIASAAAAVSAVFALFNSVLSEMVPPIPDAQNTVGFVSIGTTIVLLALTLLIRKRLTRVQAVTIAATSAVLFALALLVFFQFTNIGRTYIYRYPPSSTPHADQQRHIRGDLHERGRERVGDMTIAEAVFRFGGPDNVDALGLLWTEDARGHAIDLLQRWYIALILLITAAIFWCGIAVVRQHQAQRPRSRTPKRDEAGA